MEIARRATPALEDGYGSKSLQDDAFDYDGMYKEIGVAEAKGETKYQAEKAILKSVFLSILHNRSISPKKITLPTGLLRKLSFLEFYSGFVIPTLLNKVASGKTPFERLFYTLKYWLSCLGRMHGKYLNVKKPYTSVQGETFKCAVSEDQGYEPKEEHRENGMLVVPDDAYSFIAEQLSFDPPVSSFLAECKGTGVLLEGSLTFQVSIKFGFLMVKAIRLKQLGGLRLHVGPHSEVYAIQLPHYVVTDIATFPEVNPVGTCRITCEKTGYHATIELPEPRPKSPDTRFGVKASVFSKSDTAPIMTVEGKWNSTVDIVTGQGANKLFYKYSQIPRNFVTRCLPIRSMNWLESRRLWRHVTKSIVENDSETTIKERLKLKKRFLKLNLKPNHFTEKEQDYFYVLKNRVLPYRDVT